jgi:hypothetical protein
MCLSVCNLNSNMPTLIGLGVEIQHEVLVVVELRVDWLAQEPGSASRRASRARASRRGADVELGGAG